MLIETLRKITKLTTRTMFSSNKSIKIEELKVREIK